MKILYICKTLPYSFKGGIQTHVWKLSQWMLRLGHDVTILTAGSWIKGIQTKQMEGRQIIELPYFPGRHLPLVGTLAEEWSFNHAVVKWLEKNQTQFDVLHMQGRSGNLFLSQPNTVKTPVINTLHGFMSIEHERRGRKSNQSFFQKLHLNWVHKMEDNALKNATALIAVSKEMKRALDVRLPKNDGKTRIIPNGIDVPVKLPNITANPNTLLFVGRLDPIKGIFPLVEAMKLVNPFIQLEIIGDGPSRNQLEKAIKKANLGHRITLKGSLESAEVFQSIAASYALILPSFHETQGIVLMEANSYGKAVLASDINGINEVVSQGQNGLLFEKNHPQKMAAAINYLFANPEEANKMGAWGRTFVQQKFSWEQIAKQTEQVYYQSIFAVPSKTPLFSTL